MPFKNPEDKRKWMIGYGKKYYQKHRQAVSLKHDEYRLNNKLVYKKHKAENRYPGELTLTTLQSVYEDNIKKFGTLTCYLCLKPIEFGKDSLEHKISKTKGGTNDYSNLAISCLRCNFRKHDKSEIEFKKILQKEL
jgi:5-methylcytosine-specific restriction endonuclease McrA